MSGILKKFIIDIINLLPLLLQQAFYLMQSLNLIHDYLGNILFGLYFISP